MKIFCRGGLLNYDDKYIILGGGRIRVKTYRDIVKWLRKNNVSSHIQINIKL